jgi:hypothetical protein
VHDVAETVQALDVWQAMTAGSLTVKKPNDSV